MVVLGNERLKQRRQRKKTEEEEVEEEESLHSDMERFLGYADMWKRQSTEQNMCDLHKKGRPGSMASLNTNILFSEIYRFD